MKCAGTGKYCHQTITEALKAIRAMVTRKRIEKFRLQIFACDTCAQWHLGRIRSKGKKHRERLYGMWTHGVRTI